MDKNILQVKLFFDSRADHYETVSSWSINKKIDLIIDRFLSQKSGNIALDVGAGTGKLISRIKDYKIRIALDLSKPMLEKIEDNSIVKIVGDIHCLPFLDNNIDLVMCKQVLHYCNVNDAFKNILGVLKTGGLFFIVQIIEFDNVPESWVNKWTSFRDIKMRKHMRQSILEDTIKKQQLKIDMYKEIIIREKYLWNNFYVKHAIKKSSEKKIQQFFKNTPRNIVDIIGLKIDSDSISYNRRIGFWELRYC